MQASSPTVRVCVLVLAAPRDASPSMLSTCLWMARKTKLAGNFVIAFVPSDHPIIYQSCIITTFCDSCHAHPDQHAVGTFVIAVAYNVGEAGEALVGVNDV